MELGDRHFKVKLGIERSGADPNNSEVVVKGLNEANEGGAEDYLEVAEEKGAWQDYR